MSGEESLEDEERQRRAQKRREKKKRQKERKKLEQETGTQEDEDLRSLISGSDRDKAPKNEEWKEVRPRNKQGAQIACSFDRLTGKNKAWRTGRADEEEWDTSSAFVANVAKNIKLKALKVKSGQTPRDDVENILCSKSQVKTTEDMKRTAEALAAQGIDMFECGHYSQAVTLFTRAIHYHPSDHRFYGNRSYCYWNLKQYPSALMDAETSIHLAPNWPKGHFRKGCALMNLKRHEEAGKALEEVLNLDPHCNEASTLLASCWVLQMLELGFDEPQSKRLLEKFGSIQAVLAFFGAKALKNTKSFQNGSSCRSLWVGNVSLTVTEKDLLDLFRKFVEVESVRILRESFCAFINFRNGIEASKALDKMQDTELQGNKLVMRYPDRWINQTMASVHSEHTWPVKKTP